MILKPKFGNLSSLIFQQAPFKLIENVILTTMALKRVTESGSCLCTALPHITLPLTQEALATLLSVLNIHVLSHIKYFAFAFPSTCKCTPHLLLHPKASFISYFLFQPSCHCHRSLL